MRLRLRIAAVLAVVGVLHARTPALLPAQEFLDRGVFLITRGGAESGREEFAIRTGPVPGGGQGMRAVSSTRSGAREIQQVLELTAGFVPVSFQQTVTTDGRVTSRISAQLAGIRFSARLTSQDGETAREFPVRAPVAVLGDEAFSAFYFVPRPTSDAPRAVFIVRPTDVRAVAASVEAAGADTVAIGGTRVSALRYLLRIADGDERQFWITASGDLLQVSLPALQVVATRAEMPAR